MQRAYNGPSAHNCTEWERYNIKLQAKVDRSEGNLSFVANG